MAIEVGGGLLAVLADPRDGMAAELDRWFEDEHLYERSAIDGVLCSRRYVSLQGTPNALALYELASPAVLHEDAYLGARAIEDESRAVENARRAAAGCACRRAGARMRPNVPCGTPAARYAPR